MARVDIAPEDRDKEPLRLEGILDCPECECAFDHVFTAADGVFEREDLIDAPTEEVECPACGHVWAATWEGWLSHEDAG